MIGSRFLLLRRCRRKIFERRSLGGLFVLIGLCFFRGDRVWLLGKDEAFDLGLGVFYFLMLNDL